MDKIAAIFDLDLTITQKDSFRFFIKKQYFSNSRNWYLLPRLLCYSAMRKFRMISLQQFKEQSLYFLFGKSNSQINKIGIDFFNNYLISIIRPEAELKIKEHKEKGNLVVIATSCPGIYINLFANHLNCDAYVCSELDYNKKGFSGKLKGKDCIGFEKVSRLDYALKKFNISLEKSYGYSDSYSDLPLLEKVGNPVAVNPDFKLRQIARGRNWPIAMW